MGFSKTGWKTKNPGCCDVFEWLSAMLQFFFLLFFLQYFCGWVVYSETCRSLGTDAAETTRVSESVLAAATGDMVIRFGKP
jgi:hypothetical protein